MIFVVTYGTGTAAGPGVGRLKGGWGCGCVVRASEADLELRRGFPDSEPPATDNEDAVT